MGLDAASIQSNAWNISVHIPNESKNQHNLNISLKTICSFCPCLCPSHWNFVSSSSSSDSLSCFFPPSLVSLPPSLSPLSAEEVEESAGQGRIPLLQSRRRTSRLSRSPRVCSGWSEALNGNFQLQRRWWKVGVRHALFLLLSTPENLDEVCHVWSDGSVSPCPGGGGSPRPRGFVQVGLYTPAGSCDGMSRLRRGTEAVSRVKKSFFFWLPFDTIFIAPCHSQVKMPPHTTTFCNTNMIFKIRFHVH